MQNFWPRKYRISAFWLGCSSPIPVSMPSTSVAPPFLPLLPYLSSPRLGAPCLSRSARLAFGSRNRLEDLVAYIEISLYRNLQCSSLAAPIEALPVAPHKSHVLLAVTRRSKISVLQCHDLTTSPTPLRLIIGSSRPYELL